MDDTKPEMTHLEHGVSNEQGLPASTFRRGSPEEKALVRKIDFRVLPMLWISKSTELCGGVFWCTDSDPHSVVRAALRTDSAFCPALSVICAVSSTTLTVRTSV